jgi:ketosteroid isomerase-like protein
MATETTTGFDLDALRRAIEAHDADAVIAFYADDAEVSVIDKGAPPSSPRVLRGKDEIAAQWRDVLARDMTHDIQQEVVGPERVSFATACRYASGERVFAMTVLELRDGKIARQTDVQAWDE